MQYEYDKFTAPCEALDFLTIEQAAFNNATIVTPCYDGSTVYALEEYIQELGLNHADGTRIDVMDWEDLLKDEGNVRSGKHIVLYEPMAILSEILNFGEYDSVSIIESSDY